MEELGLFTLEDIINEFHEDKPEEEEPAEVTAEEAAPEAPEEMPEEAPENEAEEMPQEAVTGDTIRIDSAELLKGEVRNAQPVDDEKDMQEQDTEEVDKQVPPAEQFTGEWEPEYEQPMGNYVPPQPIQFQPRSRLRELKRQLVAGPEKRYYDLSEKGLAKLQLAIFFSFLVLILAAASTVMYALGMVPENRLRLLVFGQFLAMMFSALLGCFQLIEGVADIFKLRFSVNSLLVFTFFACCADGILCLMELRVPCCAAFSLLMFFSLWSAYNRRHAEMGMMDTLRKATRLDALVRCEDAFQGRPALYKAEGKVEHFMENYDKPAKPEKRLGLYCLIALVVSLVMGVAAGVMYKNVSTGVQITAVCLLAATPATMSITLSRPAAILQKRLHRLGTVICGWQGVDQLRKKLVYPLTYQDLFPVGAARMNGVKFFSSRPTDEIVAYATALIVAEGSGLAPLFSQVLESRNGRHYDAQELRGYEGGGIGGVVNDEPVLVGPLTFLKDMGVDVPGGIQVSQAVCVAIDGELCGVFAISYEKTNSTSAGLATLTGYRGLNPVMADSEFMLTENFIRYKFAIKSKRLLFPNQEERAGLMGKMPAEDAVAAVLTTREGLAPFAYGVTGARALRTASNLGVIVHMIGGGLGLALMVLLLVLGALQLLTPVNMFLYQLVWIIPGLLITEWTRSV